MKEKLQEIYGALQERLKSPFLLTFILVWSIHNWELVYGVLTFEDSMTFENRKIFLKHYINLYGTYHLFWFPIFWAFISLALYLVTSFLSEGINLIYGKWIRTFLYWAIDRNKLKTEDDYNELEKRRIALQDLVNELRRKEEDAAIKLGVNEKELKSTIANYDERIGKKDNETNELTIEIERLQKTNKEKEDQIALISSELEGRLEKIKSLENKTRYSSEDYLVGFDFYKWAQKNAKETINKWKSADTEDERTDLNVLNKFSALFGNNTWINKFEIPNKQVETELFSFKRDQYPHFLTGKTQKLFITDIKFISTNTVTFTKTGENSNKKINVVLNISNSDVFVGTENNSISVIYTKLRGGEENSYAMAG